MLLLIPSPGVALPGGAIEPSSESGLGKARSWWRCPTPHTCTSPTHDLPCCSTQLLHHMLGGEDDLTFSCSSTAAAPAFKVASRENAGNREALLSGFSLPSCSTKSSHTREQEDKDGEMVVCVNQQGWGDFFWGGRMEEFWGRFRWQISLDHPWPRVQPRSLQKSTLGSNSNVFTMYFYTMSKIQVETN